VRNLTTYIWIFTVLSLVLACDGINEAKIEEQESETGMRNTYPGKFDKELTEDEKDESILITTSRIRRRLRKSSPALHVATRRFRREEAMRFATSAIGKTMDRTTLRRTRLRVARMEPFR
jgi:hypothetical protein